MKCRVPFHHPRSEASVLIPLKPHLVQCYLPMLTEPVVVVVVAVVVVVTWWHLRFSVQRWVLRWDRW
ncbi:hypothetical protein HanXRQr2_Chr10g0419011 [Helianthus annuus]|uniref:Uncharacterized protein n=1 Tax=Helianthus annuus TaxID=4232 RepID=A0A9K3HU65_HELAN|nr:hypothetical protein HanXRQr2_Chr10g0419011 [Helianthus annuus]